MWGVLHVPHAGEGAEERFRKGLGGSLWQEFVRASSGKGGWEREIHGWFYRMGGESLRVVRGSARQPLILDPITVLLQE